MKKNELTWLQLAIYEAIKAHCTEEGHEYISMYKPIEFIEMHESGRKTVKCSGGSIDGTTLTHYTVITKFKAAKYDDNGAMWDVCIYSNGECAIYFDGTLFVG